MNILYRLNLKVLQKIPTEGAVIVIPMTLHVKRGKPDLQGRFFKLLTNHRWTENPVCLSPKSCSNCRKTSRINM